MRKSRVKNKIIPSPSWLAQESDAGCVTLGCSILDNSLGLLHDIFISVNTLSPIEESSEKLIKELMSPMGPLSGFSAKIKLGYAYGLFPAEDYKCLETLRDLRNEAAHGRFLYMLNDEGFKPLLERLLEHEKTMSLFQSSEGLWKPEPSREKRIVVAAILAVYENLKHIVLETTDRRPK